MRLTTVITALMVGSGSFIAAPNLNIAVSDSTTKAAEEAEELETLVVTATRTPKLLKNTPVQTRLITMRDIEHTGSTNISDLLQQQLPGVEFSLGMGQNTQINFSGFGGGGILFLADGERMAGETLDNPDYARLNLQNAERVEIVKGAASSLYGSNATGGVVNIISATPKEGTHLKLDSRYGSHETQRYGALATFRKGIISNSLDARYDSRGEIRFKHPGDITKAFATHSWNLRDRAVLTFSREASLTARAGYFYRQRKSTSISYDRYRDVSAGLSGRWRDITAAYAFDTYDKSDFDPISGSDTRDYRNRHNSLHAQYSHEFDATGTLTFGGDWLDDYLMSYEFAGGAHSQTNIDAYAQWDWQPAENLWIVPGARYDYFSASDANRVSPKLSLLWRTGNLALRANYAAGFRAPTLKELYMTYDMSGILQVYGNPDLKSETSQNMTLSGEWTKGSLNATISAFHNIVDNRISYIWDEDLKGQHYINIHRMHICGADASVTKAFRCGLTLIGNYVYTFEHYSKGDLRANPTRPHAVTMRADYAHAWKPGWDFTASVNFKWLSGVDGDIMQMYAPESAGIRHYPAYSMLNLHLTQKLWKRLTVEAGIDNLLNYVPATYYYNSPLTTGIGGYVGVGVRF